MYISLTNSPTPEQGAEGADAALDGPIPPSGRRRGRGPRGVRTVSSTVVTLGVVSMLTDISSESVAAILPLYITGMLGLSTVAFGLIDGMYQGVSALVRIGAGYTSDRLDQPKWVAFTGYALAAVARVGLLVWTGFGALVAVITTDRIGKGIRTAPRDALITTASDPSHLAAAFGVHRMLDNIGAALGPLIAFVILLVIPDGFSTIFVASLCFAIVGVVLMALVVPNLRSRPRRDSGGEAAGGAQRQRWSWKFVTRGPMRRVLAAAGILGLLTIGDGFVYLVLQSRSDFAAQWFPLLYVGTNVAFLAFALPLGRLADRVGRAKVFVIGHIGLLAAYVVATLPVDDIVATVLCLGFLGAFYAATDGVLSALASEFTTAETRGTGIAAAQTVVAVSRFVAASAFGILWFAIGREASVLVVAALLLVAIPVVAIVLRPLLSPTATSA